MKWSYLTSVAAAAVLSGSAFAADVDLANTKGAAGSAPIMVGYGDGHGLFRRQRDRQFREPI